MISRTPKRCCTTGETAAPQGRGYRRGAPALLVCLAVCIAPIPALALTDNEALNSIWFSQTMMVAGLQELAKHVYMISLVSGFISFCLGLRIGMVR